MRHAYVVDLLARILCRMHRLHGCHVVHRDMKMDNMMWSKESKELWLIDFGMAAHCHSTEEGESGASLVGGTLSSLPLEALLDPWCRVDAAHDM